MSGQGDKLIDGMLEEIEYGTADTVGKRMPLTVAPAFFAEEIHFRLV